jgi:hypothetical protein
MLQLGVLPTKMQALQILKLEAISTSHAIQLKPKAVRQGLLHTINSAGFAVRVYSISESGYTYLSFKKSAVYEYNSWLQNIYSKPVSLSLLLFSDKHSKATRDWRFSRR